MAESSGHSKSRKRKATVAASSPIIQLSSTGLCGCSKCWKTVVCRPAGRRSARLAAKRAKLPALPLDHERQSTKNSFVYEIEGFTENYQWDSDGRYMYRFSKHLDLMIVDLLRNTYKRLKPRTEWSRNPIIFNLAVVSPYAILVAVYVQDDDREELHLLRLPKNGDDYERTVLHRGQEGIVHSAFVLVEITGEGVDVKRKVVHGCGGGPIAFLTVDIDEPRAVVVDNAEHPFGHSEDCEFDADLSADGRELLAIHQENPHVLQVYSLAERKWTKHELEGLNVGNDPFFWYCFSPNGHIYAENFGEGDGEFLFACNLEQKKWEKRSIRARDVSDLAFIADPVDGREICRFKRQPKNAHRQRFKIERVMSRQPDSLQHQSFMAARKLQEGVEVEETLRQVLEAARKAQAKGDGKEAIAVPQKKFFPSAYDEMTPIPVRSHQ